MCFLFIESADKMINIVGRGASYKLRSKTQYPPEGSLLYPIL